MAAPRTLVSGDSASWQISAPQHREIDGWGRSLVLAGPTPLTIPVSSEDEVKITSAQSATLSPGRYAGAVIATKTDERQTLERFEFDVTPDPAAQTVATDIRSQARRTLDAINAAIEKRATKAQDELAINGQRIKNTAFTELLVLRDRYTAIVRGEEQGASFGRGRKIHIRWG